MSKVTRPCLSKAFTLQSGAVAALLYTAALCVNVSMAPMDDRLGVKTNVTTDALRDFADRDVSFIFLAATVDWLWAGPILKNNSVNVYIANVMREQGFKTPKLFKSLV